MNAGAEPAIGNPGTAGRIIVCIVDDDTSVRKSLANLLKSAGYRAQVFASGKEFLAVASLVDIACLLLDVKMNGLSGIDVLRALAHLDRKFPVICMSAYWDEAVIAESHRHGATEFLSKPFTGDALLSAVELALQGAD